MKINNIRSLCRISAIAFAGVSFFFSSTPETKAKTLDEVAHEIVKASPRLGAVSAENEASIASLATASNLPDPELEGEFLAAPTGVSDRWGVGLNWSIDWPGVYAARKREASAASDGIRASLAVARKNCMIEVGRLLLDYMLACRQIALLDEIISANDSVGRLIEKGFRGGEMTRLDMAKVRIENVSLSSRRVLAEEAASSAARSLSGIYGKDVYSLLSEMECKFPEINVPEARVLNEMMADSPSVKEAETAVETARRGQVTSAREALPSLSVGYRHAFEDGTHFNGGAVGLSIPIFSSKGKQKAAKATSVAAEYSLAAAKNDVALGIDRTLNRLESLSRQVKNLETALADADETDLLFKAYEAKVITLIELLNERNYFLETRMSYLELLHALSNARLDLDTFMP